MPDPQPRRALNEQPGPETRLLLELLGSPMEGVSILTDNSPHRREKLFGRLQMMGMVDEARQPTELALTTAPFIAGNVSVRLAAALGASRWYDTTWDTITAIAMLACEIPFLVYPGAARDEACLAHQAFQQEGSRSDLSTLLTMFERMEEIYRRDGEPAASRFAVQHFLNVQAFLQMRDLRARLLAAVREAGWSFDEEGAAEDSLTTTFFWAYPDRLLRRAWLSNKWESVQAFYAEVPRDSIHHGDRSADLLLAVGMIWKEGSPTGRVGGVAFNAMTPEQICDIVGDAVFMQIESIALAERGPESAFDVWYWGEDRLCLRESLLPEGNPLQVVQEMSRRSRGAVPFPKKTAGNPSWADLARSARRSDLQALVAETWLDFPDELRAGEDRLPVRYAENGNITVNVPGSIAPTLLPGLKRDALPGAWAGRRIIVAVDLGSGEPLTASIDELDTLQELLSAGEAEGESAAS